MHQLKLSGGVSLLIKSDCYSISLHVIRWNPTPLMCYSVCNEHDKIFRLQTKSRIMFINLVFVYANSSQDLDRTEGRKCIWSKSRNATQALLQWKPICCPLRCAFLFSLMLSSYGKKRSALFHISQTKWRSALGSNHTFSLPPSPCQIIIFFKKKAFVKESKNISTGFIICFTIKLENLKKEKH